MTPNSQRVGPTTHSTARWGILFVGWVIVILITTTFPWGDFVGHAHWQQIRWIPVPRDPSSLRDWFDVAANVLLFVPFGSFLILAGPSHKAPIGLAAASAFLLSASVEFYQVFCHRHFPSSLDICTNVVGAVLGAWLVRRYLALTGFPNTFPLET